jgi:hypothetical protein
LYAPLFEYHNIIKRIFSFNFKQKIINFEMKNISYEKSPLVLVNDLLALKIIGVYLIILFVLSIVSNVTLLWLFYINKKLRKPTDIYILTLAVNNVFGSVTSLPFIIISNFTSGYLFERNISLFQKCETIYPGRNSFFVL